MPKNERNDNIKKIFSRPWHYPFSSWLIFL